MSNPRYSLVKQELGNGEEEEFQIKSQPRWRLLNTSTLAICLLVASLLVNGLLLVRLSQVTSQIERSTFSGLPYDTPIVYESESEYWGGNETRADELWDALNTDSVAVQLSDEWAEQHGLPRAGRFPWDDERGVYFVRAFHQVHCLKNMRKMVKELLSRNQSDVPWEHFMHCADSIRQDIMCRADDTPLVGQAGKFAGDGQVVQCRSWDKLTDWIHAPERHACYSQFGDFRPVEHKLEQYAFCPPDSPYFEVSNAYFDKWGHKEPFGETGSY